jgi:hypothetical protein
LVARAEPVSYAERAFQKASVLLMLTCRSMGRWLPQWDSPLVGVGTFRACLKSQVVGIRLPFLRRPGFRVIPVFELACGEPIVLGRNLERKPLCLVFVYFLCSLWQRHSG